MPEVARGCQRAWSHVFGKALQGDPMLSRATFGTCLSARVRLIGLCRHRQVTATVWTALVEVPGGKR